MKEYLKSFEDSWYEFAYMFDEGTGKWLWSDVPYGKNKEMNFISLEDTLREKGLIYEPDEKLDKLIKQEIQFEKDFDLYQFKDVYESDEDAYFDNERLLTTEEGIDGLLMMIKQYVNDMDDENDLAQEPELKKVYDEGKELIKSLKEYRREFLQEKDDIEL